MKKEHLNIIKMAALAFTCEEYLVHSEEILIEDYIQNLKNQYRYDSLNKSKKNIVDSKIKKEVKALKVNISSWKKMLKKFSGAFMGSESDESMYSSCVDFIHRSIDKIVVVDGKVVEDKVKDHIYESLDDIKPKERSEADSVRLIAAFDNFLTTNKLK